MLSGPSSFRASISGRGRRCPPRRLVASEQPEARRASPCAAGGPRELDRRADDGRGLVSHTSRRMLDSELSRAADDPRLCFADQINQVLESRRSLRVAIAEAHRELRARAVMPHSDLVRTESSLETRGGEIRDRHAHPGLERPRVKPHDLGEQSLCRLRVDRPGQITGVHDVAFADRADLTVPAYGHRVDRTRPETGSPMERDEVVRPCLESDAGGAPLPCPSPRFAGRGRFSRRAERGQTCSSCPAR